MTILISISNKPVKTEEFAIKLLKAYASLTQCNLPEEVKFEHLPNGAPVFIGVDFPIYVSVSHSGERVAVAVSKKSVGIDIERIRDVDYRALSKRFGFEVENQKEFFTRWTLAEAEFKAYGTPVLTAFKNPIHMARVINEVEGYATSLCGEGDMKILDFDDLMRSFPS